MPPTDFQQYEAADDRGHDKAIDAMNALPVGATPDKPVEECDADPDCDCQEDAIGPRFDFPDYP